MAMSVASTFFCLQGRNDDAAVTYESLAASISDNWWSTSTVGPHLNVKVKRLCFHVFKEIANSIIAFWARLDCPHVCNTFLIIEKLERENIRIDCILSIL